MTDKEAALFWAVILLADVFIILCVYHGAGDAVQSIKSIFPW